MDKDKEKDIIKKTKNLVDFYRAYLEEIKQLEKTANKIIKNYRALNNVKK